MNFSALLTFILSLLVLFGCAKSQESNSKLESKFNYENKQEYIKMFSLEEAQDAAKNAKLKCDSTKFCSDQVGMLTYAYPFENGAAVGRCTFFVVAEDIILTNRHCIQQYFIENSENIKNKMFAIFSTLENKLNVTIGIKEIVSLSTDHYAINQFDPVFSMDYAFLRLNQKIKVKPLELSRKGLPSELPLYVLSVNPVKIDSYIGGEMVMRLCSVIYNTIAIPTFNNEFRPVASFTDCEIKSGNSGSPAIDESGNVRAIINGTSKNKSAHHLAFGNNMACIIFPNEIAKENVLNNECKILPDSEAARAEWMKFPVMSSLRMQNFFDKMNSFIEFNGNNIDPKYLWKAAYVLKNSELDQYLSKTIISNSNAKSLLYVTMRPGCIRKRDGIFGMLKSKKQKIENIKIPIWTIRLEKNDFSQYEYKSELIKEVDVMMIKTPVKANKNTNLQMKINQIDVPNSILMGEEISYCQ